MNCVCGRSNEIVHCPSCGRGDVYAVKRLELNVSVTDSGGIGASVPLRGYRCRKCGAEFREGTQCTAPPVKLSRKEATKMVAGVDDARKARLFVIETMRKINPQRADDLEKQYVEQGLI